MKNYPVIATILLLAIVGLANTACKKKPREPNLAHFQTPEGTVETIQQLRLQLTEAVEKKNLQYVHDSMYYFKGLCTALSSKLQGEKKQRVDSILAELTDIAEEIDNSAGRGNQAGTEANLKKLINELKVLEGEFKGAKKQK